VNDSWRRNHLIRDGFYRAIYSAMQQRPEVILCGEGAHMKVHYDAPDIERNFADRVLTLPISEDGNTNFAVGLALGGMVPIVDIITADFMLRSFDSICNTAAKLEHVSGAKTIVIKGEFLTGGPTTGQRVETMFCHTPGLRVGVPSTPKDAETMMLEALKHPGVTVLFEEREIQDTDLEQSIAGDARGVSATVVSYGRAVHWLRTWLQDVDIVDLRWLWPLEMRRIRASVSRTNGVLVVEPGPVDMGIGAEIVARLAKEFPDVHLERLGMPRVVLPVAAKRHAELMPDRVDIRKIIHHMKKGYEGPID
jgi:pyruvate/2-oxoglutarate/acetoin dehydrogenase E1 component